MFSPKRLLKVLNSAGDEIDLANFCFHQNQVLAASSADIPFLKEEEIFPTTASERSIEKHQDGVRYLHFSEGSYFHGLQVTVDYETDDVWNGPVPEHQAFKLPHFLRQMREGKSVSLVLVGDSISEGANASGWTGAFPFQPAYGELLKQRLATRAKGPVKFHNISKSGMTSEWGLHQSSRVAELSPDLVIIAFGMNDVSEGIPAEDLCKNVGRLVDKIRQSCRQTDFIVVSGMSPNPAWHLSYPKLRQDAHDGLSCLAASGVAFCDVRSVWDEIVKRKGTLSLTGNGVNHPNDFGHRIYCDCLMSVIGEEP